MASRWIRQTNSKSAIVFIHGILSSSETCWKNETTGAYWPDMVSDADRTADGPSVYVADYHTSLDAGTYSVDDAAEAVFEETRLAGALVKETIVFVCHSMGGLVARRMLVHKRRYFANKDLGLWLVASPSLGSNYATWLTPIARFFKQAHAEALRMGEDNLWLDALDRDFLALLDERSEEPEKKIQGRELYEDNSIFKIGMINPAPVVSPLSARRYFQDSIRIPGSNHFTIAKPSDSEALQHKLLVEFIRKLGSKIVGTPTLIPSTPPLPPGVTSADAFLKIENLADFVFAAEEEELKRLIAAVPPGSGIGGAFIPQSFVREFLNATNGLDIHERINAASALVTPLYPKFKGRYELIAVYTSELLGIGQEPTAVLHSALSASCKKGPRTLAAIIVEAPSSTLVAARNEVHVMLTALLKGEAR